VKVSDMQFERSHPFETDVMHSVSVFLPTQYGVKRTRITVLDRMTGFGHRDIETGFRDVDGRFWLASGDFDIRWYPQLNVNEAIYKIKKEANSCRGQILKKCFDIKTREQLGNYA
jgi:hypothetical protein